ncbi:erythromycin esterase family protein [Streptomyces sp. NBC_01565]|uniref:erythromycin esterase family protein n=1 Tax=Streptomyces sp. NBC_01565 TaxID=2975881 RepID=UPI00225A67B7|nr:erythromycin esterase family protein [Streptomyces sp. NBC_01565]MCX4546164.1 erythromycin esterase family protein [Streptomyces sp. NBC_01565]
MSLSRPLSLAEGRDTLRWLRAHNATAPHPVRFAGLDVPAAGGSPAPVLEPVARYLADVDSGAVHYARTALELSEPLAGGSGLVPAHQMQRAMSELLGGAPDAADLGARDRYLPDSLLHLIDRSAPGTRIVVSAHNAHIQRTANPEGGPLVRTLRRSRLHIACLFTRQAPVT